MTSEPLMKPHLSLLTACLLLGACARDLPPPQSDILPPAAWQAPTQGIQASLDPWWRQFGSPQLARLVEQARLGSYDVAAAMARVRQAQAQVTIAGGPLLPELKGNFTASREQLLRNNGYSQLSADSSNKAVDSFNATLTASYEVDFWGARAAARDSAEHSLRASRFDQANVELTLLGNVANSYLDVLALREQEAIARLNLANAQQVLGLVQTRYDSGSANAQELAQQKGLVAAQQRQLPLFRQQTQDALVTLATLLGQPVQNLALDPQPFQQVTWPPIDSGLPSQLLSRRPDIATAEARLAAAQADVQVARAAMLPTLTLTANLGSGANRFPDVLRNPFYNVGAGLVGPIFNNGRLGAERDKASAVQEELLQTYRGAIIAAFGDVEKALNGIDGLDQQRRWQNDELEQAQIAFRIAENRYRAGAQDLLSVLDTQRTLYQAQDQDVQLRLSRLKASVALYKALGGGWQVR
ncbi:efflux transporter, outer membrane factor (OMF) lipoprotein, NodT family [Pseudomonas sp. NFIX28]|nr:efflux transporter, outer membrane factor (OMF) lipoprotein, NodT family [Pseudomonas sp. NFIX28]